MAFRNVVKEGLGLILKDECALTSPFIKTDMVGGRKE